MANQQSQFNIQNALFVQQSNAEYLRQVNTANTAVQNQDNQLNAQNAMNLSTQAMANLQTEFNDTATMLYNSNMTAEQQSYAMTYLSQQFGLQQQLNASLINAENNQFAYQQIGTLASNLFAPVVSGIGSVISGAFSGSANTTGSVSGNTTNNVSGNGSSNNMSGNGSSSNVSGSSSGSFLDNVGSAASSAGDFISNTVSDIGSSISSGASDLFTSLFG